MLVNLNPAYKSPNFERKPNSAEMKKYTQSIEAGLRVLDKELGVIIHNSTVPSFPKQNLGIGSLLSKVAQATFIPFLVANGVSTIQQEPNNLRGNFVFSPYSPQSNSKNIYMFPIERLATEEYGNLISKDEIRDIVKINYSRKTPNRVDYAKTAKTYDNILSNAYFSLVGEQDEHMIEGLSEHERLLHIQLENEFEEFKKENRKELTPAALYEILSKKNNNENWKTWAPEERNLFKNSDKKTLNTLISRNQSGIDFFMFKQWLVEREISKSNARNEKMGIKIVGDSPIAFTPVEEWMNQDLFMKNWALGCPPDRFSDDGQRWGFSVLKPETIFNPDGSLGKGGELLKTRYEKMFESSPGGARIDHIIGLIDPFVYRTDVSNMNGNNSGRLYSSPDHPVLGKYARVREEQYSEILEKIVFPAAEKYGLSKDDIICEDLGTLTDPVKNIMKKLNLRGIAVTQFDYRGKDTPAKNVIMPGSHDNESMIEYTNTIFEDKGKLDEKVRKLVDDTRVPNENWNSYKWELSAKKSKFIAASFAELFTSPAKKIQIFFTTFFGIGKTYNQPGQTKNCWTLRIPEKYDQVYWENVKKGIAPNLPEAIARAIRNKGEEFSKPHKSLLKTLDDMTQILKS